MLGRIAAFRRGKKKFQVACCRVRDCNDALAMSLMHCWVIDVLHYCKDLKSLAQKSQAKYTHHAFGMEVYDPKGEDTQELRKSHLTRMGRIAASSKSATIVLCSGYPVCQVNASNHTLVLLGSFQEHQVNDKRFRWAGQACTKAGTTSHELSVGEDLQAIPHDRIPHVISPATKAEPESGGIYAYYIALYDIVRLVCHMGQESR